MKKSLVFLALILVPCLASATPIYCFVIQHLRGHQDNSMVVKKAVDLLPTQQGPLMVATVEGVTYQVTMGLYNELHLHISGNGLPYTLVTGDANSQVSAALFDKDEKIIIDFTCSAKLGATPYRVMKCDEITPDCHN